MAILNTQALYKVNLSSYVSTSKQISDYTDSTFVHISGDINIGNIQLSGGLSSNGNVQLGNGQDEVYMNTKNGISGIYLEFNDEKKDLDSVIDTKILSAIGPINEILDKLING